MGLKESVVCTPPAWIEVLRAHHLVQVSKTFFFKHYTWATLKAKIAGGGRFQETQSSGIKGDILLAMECRFRRIGAVQRLRAKTTTKNAAENGNAATGRVHPKSLGGTSMSPSKRGALLFPLKICGEIITSVKENGAQIPRHSSSSYLQVHFYLTPARVLSAFSPRLQFVL